MKLRYPLLAVLFGLAACQPIDDTTAPSTPTAPVPSFGSGSSDADEEDLVFLRNEADAPSFATGSVSFWAHTKQTRQASIYYHARPGQSDSTEFIRFRVDKGSLLSRPNGTPFASTDSIMITITVSDSSRLILTMEPSGLRFSPKTPARLWFKWSESDDDRNDDGAIDAIDDTWVVGSQVWKQEVDGDPWSSVKTSVDTGLESYSAKITGFTRYAVAY